MRALIVESDQQTRAALARVMGGNSIYADLVGNAQEAVRHATSTEYAVILIAFSLADLDGGGTCRRMRDLHVNAPIMVLSSRSVDDRIAALSNGADDCLGRRFSSRELLARIRALTRRGPTPDEESVSVGDLVLDPRRHEVRRGATSIPLTRKEFAVLQLLMSHPNAVLSRRFLLDQAWGYGVNERSNLVEVYIRYLRIKIDRPFGCQTLQTVRGAGYRLCSEDRATLATDRRAIGSAGDGLR